MDDGDFGQLAKQVARDRPREKGKIDMEQVALITGVSSGIGRETAILLAERGLRVFGTYRKKHPSGLGPAITLLQMDVTNDEAVHQAVGDVIRASGRIDVLINNAGYALFGALEETSLGEARDQFDTNFFGALRVTQYVLPVMRRQRYGRIVNMSSILGVIPGPFSGAYAASKYALEGYTETLDHEVLRFGIRAMLVEPSFVRTGLLQKGKVVSTELAEYAGDRAAVARAFDRALSNGSDPKQVAETVYRALIARSPRMRYPVGEARILSLLHRFVPARMFAKSLRKRFALNPHVETEFPPLDTRGNRLSRRSSGQQQSHE
jgi:NAD(P)-dependent dehydrogenase (short-subunit alcohol dehydrogenase family)